MDFHYLEKKCPMCGKKFIARAEWAYKQYDRYYCSWHCLQEMRKGKPSRAQKKERIIQAIRDGLTNAEILNLLGEPPSTVDYWRRKLKEAKDDA